MRLNKYLAMCSIGSRRECDQFIIDGQVLVNQKPAELGMSINRDTDIITVNGVVASLDQKKYYLFYKPVGVLTTNKDPFNRPCLGDYIKKETRLFSIGRLDADSEGLLLLTNDGDFGHRMQHPKYKVKKTYHVWVNHILTKKQEADFCNGIKLAEGITAPAIIRSLGNKEYIVELKQGWNRQIRRMFAVLNIEVLRLKRIAIGQFTLGDLRPGEILYLDIKKPKKF